MPRARLLLALTAIWGLGACSGGVTATTVVSTSPVTTPQSRPTAPPTTVTPVSPASTLPRPQPLPAGDLSIEAFPVPSGSRPHDVAPAQDGGVWFTAQGSGELGWLDPQTGAVRLVPLGVGSRPHGVIVSADGTAWITDGGLNAIVAVEPGTDRVRLYPLPDDRPDANLNTATFDDSGALWFTGQAGYYGRLDPAGGEIQVFDAPRGRGPYGITTSSEGGVYFASLAGSYLGRVEPDGSVTVLEPPTPGQGARRVWSDSTGAVWVSEWNTGQVSRYQPDTGDWTTWKLPGGDPSPYAIYVDETDSVWLSDFGANALVRFLPDTASFDVLPLPSQPGNVRQLHGLPGEVWGAESAADQLLVVRLGG